MQWIEIAVTVIPAEGDAVADVLAAYGHEGVSISRDDIQPDHWDEGELPEPDVVTVRAYLVADERAEAARADLDTALSSRGYPPARYSIVDDQDWADAWKAYYHTSRVGRRIVIRPVWEDYAAQPDDVVISLDPGMAFGTGTHATTRLCLMSIEDLLVAGDRVLDLGSGSGILAIGAVMLGAAHVLAVDIDPMAADISRENAEVNGVAHAITAQAGTLATVLATGQTFDLLLANILARIIIQLCDEGLGEVVRAGGRAIFSGIILEQVEDVKAALDRAGYQVTFVRVEGDWVSIEAVKR
jgi:ribosomal protein L11 methyltransferase